jgi:hypothetical protein
MNRSDGSVGFPPIPGARGRDDDSVDNNPFKLPADDQIFRMREEEKRQKLEEKKQNQHKKIWEKKKDTTMSNTARMEELVGETYVKGFHDLNKTAPVNRHKTGTGASGGGGTGTISTRRQEKENMSEFIAKKREMFLVQMSLDTKREEIRKLEEKAQMKEEALQRSEQMLEEDAMRFDAFLKENDKKAHDAIKRAEEETKKKQEKTQEIKRLTQQIQALTSEMSKHKEALEDCLRYKIFLDMLTPPEWFEQHRRLMSEKKFALKKQNWEMKLQVWEGMKKRLVEAQKKEMMNENLKKENQKNKNKKRPTQQQQQTHGHQEDHEENGVGGGAGGGDSPRFNIPPPPRLEDEPEVEMEDEEVPMYFTHPQQLMDIFAALEEQNLFLIQNSQETEHTLEELRLAYKETAKSMNSQTDALQQQIQELKNEIFIEEKRAKDLLIKKNAAAAATSATGGDGDGMGATGGSSSSHNQSQSQYEKEKLLSDLHVKVRYVYEQCGFDASSKPSTLFMLSQLESRLELLLSEIDKMPQDYVIKSEKDKEKKRRERKREEQQSMQEKLQEERNKRAIERSLQAPKKRTGRQVMFRSKPIRKERVNHGDDNNNGDNNDEIRFLS